MGETSSDDLGNHEIKQWRYEMKAILVTTKYRGVYFGFVDDDANLTDRTMRLTDSKCAIYWATTKGVVELAEKGPNSKRKVGSPCTVTLHGITAVWECTEKAVEAWKKY